MQTVPKFHSSGLSENDTKVRTWKTYAMMPFKAVWNIMYTFFGFSSLHGFAHITQKHRHPVEKCVWMLIVSLALWGSFTLGWTTWKRFQSNPTVVSMERNYKEWNTSFPAITLCPTTKYSEENIKRTLEEFEYVKDKAELRRFLKELGNVSFGTFNAITADFPELKRSDYWRGVVKMAFPFEYKVSNSNPEHYSVFRMNTFFSELGLCYSYNSDSTYYNDPGYWEQDRWSSLGKFPVFRSSPLDGDIFAQLRYMNSGYEEYWISKPEYSPSCQTFFIITIFRYFWYVENVIPTHTITYILSDCPKAVTIDLYVFGPSEFPDVSLPRMDGPNNTYKTLDLTALSIVSSAVAKQLSIQQRRCRLQHESNLITSPIYSYNICRMECRMKASYELCKCVPFFYRQTGNYPVCGFKGMQCLQNYSYELIRLVHADTGERRTCDCYPLCDEVNYLIDSENTMSWTLGTNLKIGLVKYPKFRLKRDILFGQIDLLVSFGGSAGFFLGCSILSLVEVFYYFVMRLYLYFRYNMPLEYAG